MEYTRENLRKMVADVTDDMEPGIKDLVWAITELFAADGEYKSPDQVFTQFGMSVEPLALFLDSVMLPMAEDARQSEPRFRSIDPRFAVALDALMIGLLVGRKQAQ